MVKSGDPVIVGGARGMQMYYAICVFYLERREG